MTTKASVLIKPIDKKLTHCIRECFDTFGGIEEIIKGNVFVKINGTGPFLSAITNPEVILATIKVIKESSSNFDNIYIFENSAVSTFTRIVFKLKSLDKRIKKAGGNPLYLDEQKAVNIDFKGKILDKAIPIPKIIHENLIEHREENTYINLPKLKSHLLTDVTICIKNQLGFLYDAEKIFKHHKMDQKLIDILNVFKPDFNIVDATTVIDYGPVAYKPEWEIKIGILIAGKDPVAVDTVSSYLIGIENVKHIQMAANMGFGCNDFDEINVMPTIELIEHYKSQLHFENYPFQLPPNVSFFKGKEKACRQGCTTLESGLKLTSLATEIGPCVGIAGRGHDVDNLDKFTGPFIVSGPCAVNELKSYFENREDRNNIDVHYLYDHMNLAKLLKAVEKTCKIPFADRNIAKIPISRFQLLLSYLKAKLHRINCII